MENAAAHRARNFCNAYEAGCQEETRTVRAIFKSGEKICPALRSSALTADACNGRGNRKAYGPDVGRAGFLITQ